MPNAAPESAEQIVFMAWAQLHLQSHPELALLHSYPIEGFRYPATANRLRRLGARAGVPDVFLPDQRQDWLHKLTTDLVTRYDGLCIEDLSLKGMARTKLSKSVLDAALGEFRRHVEYKSVWHRKHLGVVDRFFPSSKLCRECGTLNQDLTLSDRVWVCGCGAVYDRDLNAARNIRAEGMRNIPVAVGHTETQNACGEPVRPRQQLRHGSVKQESHVL